MPRPKPPEELEAIQVRLPRSLAQALDELCAAANSPGGMSRGKYCAVVLQDAIERRIIVNEETRHTLTPQGGVDIHAPPTQKKQRRA